MDSFEQAAKRLEQEHRRLRAHDQEKRSSRSYLGSPTTVAKTQQVEEYRRKQLQQKREKDLREKRRLKLLTDYIHNIEIERLGYVPISLPMDESIGTAKSFSTSTMPSLWSEMNTIHLKPTSIHGQGDKITRPPSMLSLLVQRDMVVNPNGLGQPLFFRLAVARDGYTFPTSVQLHKYATDKLSSFDSQGYQDEEDDDIHMCSMETSVPYLCELAHKFVSYTFSTVIEFTEEEGCIGLPYSIARALLDPAKCDGMRRNDLTFASDDMLGATSQDFTNTIIEHTTTVDPSVASTTQDPVYDQGHKQASTQTSTYTFEQETPGHPAYGAFPVPSQPIQVSLLTHLPLGTQCSLRPTQAAIEHGFHRLKDIKYVLEQSLIKTRAALSVGDSIHAWFRGFRFDLTVQGVEPSDFGVVSCVNTDITVDIVSDAEDEGKESSGVGTSTTETHGHRLGRPADDLKPTGEGTVLTGNSKATTENTTLEKLQDAINLPLEPTIDGENILTIQIRGNDVVSKRRRFDASTTSVQTLFDYARFENIIQGDSSVASQYRLVTRFPRRVFEYVNDGDKTLLELGMGNQTQIMLLLERI